MLDPPSVTRWFRVLTRTLDDDHGRERARVVEALPRRHVVDRVRAEDEEQLAVIGRELLERVGGDRRPVSLDFDGARFHTQYVCDRGGHERETIFRRGDDAIPLLPGVAGDHQQHTVEVERGSGIDGGHEVPDVRWVEGAAEHSETLGAAHQESV